MKIDLINISPIDFDRIILFLKFIDEFSSFVKYFNRKLTLILLTFVFYNRYKRKDTIIFINELINDISNHVAIINKRKSLIIFVGKYYSDDIIESCECSRSIINMYITKIYFKIRIIRKIDNIFRKCNIL